MPVNTSDLIGDFSEHIKIDFAGKETIYYYIDNSYGNIYSEAFYYGYEYSYPHDSDAEKFIENVFQSIDGYIELDFERTYSKSQGNIDIYYLGTYYEGLVGLTWSATPYDSNVEIFWEKQREFSYIYGNYGSLKDSDAYTLIHEIGHAIGLDHPNDDPYGNWHNSNDTVMSYNFIYDENLTYTQAPSWSSTDIAALQIIWGIETGNTPTSISLSSTNFNENIQANTSIATLSTTDADVNDTFTYTLVSGAGDTDNSYFSINGSSLKINSSPDYETKSSYNVRIKTTDSGNNSYEKSFTLSVNDLNEVIGSPPTVIYFSPKISTTEWIKDFTWSFNENIPAGSIIGKFAVDDPDKNDTHQYFFVDADNNSDNNLFTIEDDLLKINSSPDFETKNKYTVYLVAEDNNKNQTKNTYFFNFEVNDLANEDVIASNKYTGKSYDYTFINQGNGKYGIKKDDSSQIDPITGLSLIEFSDKSIDIEKDVIGTFDQVTGLNTASGKMFRLYNAAFARFPDADGLKYWIEEYSSGRNSERVVAQSFLASAEFKDRYGFNVSNAKYVETLYVNVLGRDYDQSGYSYWLGQLNSGNETRHELLLGFAESAENKALFTEITGFY